MVSFDNFMILHSSGIFMQENHYYPYGMLIEGLSNIGTGLPQNMYRYTDKEAQNDLNQNLLDFGWRQYDPVIARWHVTDPAEQFYNPYLAIAANPISIIDPDGRKGTSPPWEDAGKSDQLSADLNGFGGGGSGGFNMGAYVKMNPYDQQAYLESMGIDNSIYAITSNGATTVCSTCGSTEMQNGAVVISNVNTGTVVGVISSANGTYSSAASGQTISSTNGHLFLTENISVIEVTEMWNGNSYMGFSGSITRHLGNFVQQGGEPNPTYTYKDESGLTATQLYTTILIDKAAEQFGIIDIAALAAIISGQPILPKRFNTEGATKGTSPASKYLSKIKKELPFKMPTLTNQGIRTTKSIGRILGRGIPIVGWTVLVYDMGIVLYNTQIEYDKIVGGGQ